MNMGWAPRGRTPGGTGRTMNQNDQLTVMRDVRWEPRLQTLVANPIEELKTRLDVLWGERTARKAAI